MVQTTPPNTSINRKGKHMAIVQKLSNAEIASFCSQTAIMLNAGIAPAEGMDILLRDTKSDSGRAIIEQIRDICNTGESFYTAIEQTGVFPEYVLNMIQLGEQSGNLEVTVQALADYYERQESISESIKNAVSYPMIMIFMMLLVIIVLITKVLPIFSQVFEQLGSQMNALSTSLMNIGQRLSSSSIVLVILLILVLVAYIFFTKTPIGKKSFTRFLNVFPPTKKFYDAVACSRFASGLAMTMASGLDTFQSLDMLSDLVENPRMQAKIDICRHELEEGASLPEALDKSEIFSALYSRMIAVGFTTGDIDTVMNRIADSYDIEVEKRIHNIISVLEPTLVIILSLIVGMILLSVILPLMGIMSSIG